MSDTPLLRIVDHPLIQHKLTLLRKRETPTAEFRRLLREISLLMGYEVTRDLPLTTRPVVTPIAEMEAPFLAGKKLCLVSIMRAGSGILDGMLDLLPAARVGHIGIYRDPGTLVPVEYYHKLPADIAEREAIVVDPMIATGHSAVAAVQRLKESEPLSIKFVTLLAARDGLTTFHEAHPDVPIYAAAVDEQLDENHYIVPGMGDAGDRLFGTR
jgi:uracil phosphoribosyltransferase